MEETIKKYEYCSKKVERVLIVIFVILFFLTFKTNPYTEIAFYGPAIIVIMYYFIWFRKKPAYLTIGKDSIIVSRGLFLKLEEIKNQDIKKIAATDKKIEIHYQKDGMKTEVSIFNILLDIKDKDEIIKYLKGLTSGQTE